MMARMYNISPEEFTVTDGEQHRLTPVWPYNAMWYYFHPQPDSQKELDRGEREVKRLGAIQLLRNAIDGLCVAVPGVKRALLPIRDAKADDLIQEVSDAVARFESYIKMRTEDGES